MNLFEQGVRNLVAKAREVVQSRSRGSLSQWVSGTTPSYGQPNLSAKVSAERMREVVMKTPTAAAALNTILDYAANVPIHPRNTNHSDRVAPRADKFIRDLLDNPNPSDTSRQFRYKVMRDLVTLGQSFIEIERGENGGVANLFALDPLRLLVDFDESGHVSGFNQQDHSGNVVIGKDKRHTWPAEDVIWLRMDTISSSQYPTSRLEQLYAAAVLESLMLAFIGGRFTDSNVPFGLFDLGDVTETEIETAVALWNQQVAEKDHPEHRIIFTGSRGSKFYPFGYHLKDLEAPELLSRVRLQILSIVGVTVNELGESDSVNKANGYNLTFTFKKRAIEPLLEEYTGTLTRRLVQEALGFKDTELWFADIDSRDELLQSQIDKLRLDTGTVSINEVRNRDGRTNIDGGDEPTLNLGSSAIPVSMLDDFAKAQLDALKIINEQARIVMLQNLLAMQQQQMQMQMMQLDPQTGQPLPMPDVPELGMLGTLPLIRGVQPPEKFTTPLGSGSSTTKFKTPQPVLNSPSPSPQPSAPSNGQPQAPRGPVQTLRNSGLRKEDLSGQK